MAINWFYAPQGGYIPGRDTQLENLTVTQNGTYNPDPGKGFAQVNVNVEGGGGETWQTVFEGSVTTSGDEIAEGLVEGLSSITANSIKITLNGVEYTCNFVDDGYAGSYGAQYDEGTGAFDFSEYPFNISNRALTHDVAIVTQTAGTYTLKIEEPQSGGSSDFSTAEVTINWDPSIIGDELSQDNCPVILRDELDEHAPYLTGNLYVTTSPVVVEVPLYNGKCYWGMPQRGTTVTGNIEELYQGFLITGDCTITIS